ncbi:hypothetical protein [Pseudomonas taetrolens]|uniref:hypothetical protein n=1 Tax=Pseudomonas taetrolens TaxID=47884 RepID=UPI003F9E20FD
MTAPSPRLPFGFARRFGVLLDARSTPAVLLMRDGAPPDRLGRSAAPDRGRAGSAASQR